MFGGLEDAFGKMHNSFLEMWGVKDNTELVNLVDTQSRTYATKLQAIVGDLTEEVSDLIELMLRSFLQIPFRILAG